ncbi:hypothetical protein AB0C10_21985 [Microbispora amethystogenes]|uniref:hypothetical protein n=1 Tax=Microbispora amethystogenes TaxID=1427754 RepID=UPI003401BB2F
MTPLHQITVPAHDGIGPDEEPQATQDGAGQRCQEGSEENSILGREPRPGAELPFEDGDLVTQGDDLDVLVTIPIGSSRSAAKALGRSDRRGEGA